MLMTNVLHGILFCCGGIVCIIAPATAALPSNLCQALANDNTSRAYLVHRGKLKKTNQAIDIGSIKWTGTAATSDHAIELSEAYLLIKPPRIVAEGTLTDALHIELTAVEEPCPDTRAYRVNWRLDPKLFGAGRFEAEFAVNFEDPDDAYQSNVKLMFKPSIKGVLHGPWLTLTTPTESIDRFLAGNSAQLKLTLRNSGDRELRFQHFLDNGRDDPKTILITNNGCRDKALAPGKTCHIELTANGEITALKLAESRDVLYYRLYIESNDLGADTILYLGRDREQQAYGYIKRW